MKKLLFVTLLLVSLIGKSAPAWIQYDNLLSSPYFIEQVELTAKIHAKTRDSLNADLKIVVELEKQI